MCVCVYPLLNIGEKMFQIKIVEKNVTFYFQYIFSISLMIFEIIYKWAFMVRPCNLRTFDSFC
jgi:hypothetical protein